LYVEYIPRNLACPRTIDLFEAKEKLLMRRTGDYPVVTYDNKQTYNLHTLYSCRVNSTLPAKYILGLLNSRLLKYIYQSRLGTEVGRTFAEIKIVYIRQLPAPMVNSGINVNNLVSLVDRMLTLNKDLQQAKTPQEKIKTERQIAATDKEIDTLVYELYGLTEEEIRVLEGE
jgi:adenine-specific DNA-methyltransferase